ncbi:MarR family winged helix-turn-helix transcriptional regulator [Nonomuraea sp. 10N515B]|uniref:MarR family winged helix-turn-helix transcriptional regulator n=1 Tax=Nonomuraea sp. 10N515B TaxID=3457422 RepID=UPI003FCC2C5C
MTSHPGPEPSLALVLEAFGLIVGRWTTVGMQDIILERAGVEADAASMTLLWELSRAGGTARPSHLAQITRTSASNISKVLGRMTAWGLVERTTEPGDLRAVAITLTPAGQRAVEAINRTSVEMLGEVMKDWPQQDIDQFGHLLNRFAQSIRASFLA